MNSPSMAFMRKSVRGFTLVEMVTVIIVLGILVVGVSSFIIFGTRIFVESSSVDQVLSQSRFAVERMTRDLRNALPNSVRLLTNTTTGFQCIEFVPIEASTTYLSVPIAPNPAAGSGTVVLDNTASKITTNQYVWIYPLTNSDVYDNARQKRTQIKSITILNNQINLTFNASFRFAEASPRQRIYFAANPVSYCFEREAANRAVLRRYSTYNELAPIQLNPTELGQGILMAENIANNLTNSADLPVILTPSNLVNNAMVHLQPRFNVNGETFQYRHQVQVMNVP